MKKYKTFSLSHQLLLIIFLITSCNGQDTLKKAQFNIVKSNKKIDNTKERVTSIQPTSIPSLLHTPPISPFVRRIFQDSKGDLWFGTNGDGVIRYRENTLQYFSVKEGFGGVAVRGILEDSEGNIWFGTENGLTKYDGISFINFTENDGLINKDIWSLFIDSKGVLWIGTLGGVYQFNGQQFIPFPIPETKPDTLRGVTSSKIAHCITEDSKGNMWFGTSGGAFVYDGTSLTNISEKDGLPNNSVNSILEDKDHHIWFATHHKGISRYDGKSFTNYTANGTIQGNEVWSIYEDPRGDLWFPAENYGVYRYDGKSFTNYDKKDGLITNAIQCFYEDNQGRFWLGGWMGLFRYDGNTFKRVTENGPWKK